MDLNRLIKDALTEADREEIDLLEDYTTFGDIESIDNCLAELENMSEDEDMSEENKASITAELLEAKAEFIGYLVLDKDKNIIGKIAY